MREREAQHEEEKRNIVNKTMRNYIKNEVIKLINYMYFFYPYSLNLNKKT